LIWIFENDRFAPIMRIVSLILFAAGFHFDMLAS
jgi:hypothetical protein